MMKKQALFALTALLFLTAVFTFSSFRASDSESGKKSKAPDITGTWKLESYRYGSGSSAFTSLPENRPRIKLITNNSFQWASYDPDTRKIMEAAGGTYTLEGDKYTETLNYGYNMDSYTGTQSIFSIKIENDMMFISGKLSTGYQIEEVWQKVK